GATAEFVSKTGSATPAASCDRPDVAGEWRCDQSSRSAAASDFGGIVSRTPRAVYRPASRDDLADLLRWATRQGVAVAARGQGHSTYGRAMTENGIVVDMTALAAIGPVQADRVAVEAGATWDAVLAATLPHGLTPPVLTNYLGLSVGGTLAIGGIGGTTSRFGFQTDTVLELDAVTGGGEALTCSASANADLFDAVRAGLGQCGIVVRATLGLVRAPERVRRYQLFYPDLATLTADQQRTLADGRFHQLQGAILPNPAGGWRYQLDGAVFYDGDDAALEHQALDGLSDRRSAAIVTDATYRDDMSAFAKLEQALRSNGQWFNPHPWLLTFLRASNAERIARDVVAGLTPTDLGPFGRVTYYPMSSRAVRTPLLRLPDEAVVFPFNLIRIPASGDRGEAEHAVGQNRELYERIRDAGGVLYPVSALPFSPDDWKRHLGARWQSLREAVGRYDPANILTPGYEPFGSA
ncbi:MAG: FAD-binding protein, partial [Reyranella sp.]